MLFPTRLRCDYRTNPMGIDTTPRLYWISESTKRNQRQSAYQILVADDAARLAVGDGTVWDSGRVESDHSTHIRYAGAPLESGKRYWWQVRVWDADGNASPWSDVAWWQMGVLDAAVWQAEWISFDTGAPGEMEMKPAPYLRRAFTLEQPVLRATLYSTAKGLMYVRLNGQAVGESVMTPDWTEYAKRISYNSHDVTAYVQAGANVLGAIVGDGWYSGYVGFQGGRNYYGTQPEFLAQLHLEFADGTTSVISTDGEWRGAVGAIVYSDMLMGEYYDARRELTGWDTPDYDASGWGAVTTAANRETLVASSTAPVEVVEYRTPEVVTEPTEGVFVFDLGQNFSGWVRLTVAGEAGTSIEIRYGELLNKDGSVYTDNLRRAKAIDTYILNGVGVEQWEPHFTYHGFRYVEVRGFPGTATADTILGCVVHTNIAITGTFESSSPLVNQIWQNALWGQRGNFVSVPTDCPQRDERLGWLGDVLIFARTACYNMDSAAFFSRWMTTVVDGQSDNGAFGDVAPRVVTTHDGAPGWGDMGVYLPWLLHRVYGDVAQLEQHYPAMVRWMNYLSENNDGYLRTATLNRNYGDWVSHNADTPRPLLATAFWAYDAQLMVEMATLLGHNDDAAYYQTLFEQIRTAFQTAYVSTDGHVEGETQTGYLLALAFNLLPDTLKELAAGYLVADIEARGWHLSTGFVGTPYLLPTLSDVGYSDVAYKLLFQESAPSWGYMVQCGATTIWERWNSLTPDGEVFDPANPTFLHPDLGPIAGMNSFNHYAFGTVGEWLYRYVTGIDSDPTAPGYKQSTITPHIGGGLTHAHATYDSLHGQIESGWRLEGEQLTVDITIPANTTATLTIPTTHYEAITEMGKTLYDVKGIHSISVINGKTVLVLGSGSYQFGLTVAQEAMQNLALSAE